MLESTAMDLDLCDAVDRKYLETLNHKGNDKQWASQPKVTKEINDILAVSWSFNYNCDSYGQVILFKYL